MSKRPRRKDSEKEAFWRAAVELQKTSGLSVGDFCAREGLETHTFYRWRREIARRDGNTAASSKTKLPAKSPADTFVPVAIAPSPGNSTGLEIIFTSGTTIRVASHCNIETLCAVVSALEPREC